MKGTSPRKTKLSQSTASSFAVLADDNNGGGSTSSTNSNRTLINTQNDDITCRCKLCDSKGCDVRILRCGCTLHARCCPIYDHQIIRSCPMCKKSVTALHLMPMNFEEIDVARQVAVLTSFSDKRGKKRKNATVARLINTHHDLHQVQLPSTMTSTITAASATIGTNAPTYISPSIHPLMPDNTSSTIEAALSMTAGVPPPTTGTTTATAATSNADNEAGDLRTGRWTQEETDYCDALIQLFEHGKIPIPDGIKLNEFLANMLKSKQARLTKKMKNAKLAARQYKRSTGYIPTATEAQAFSMLENKFYASIKCPMERSEIRFHMQKEWRELFSTYCISMGQILDASAWLSSVEELDQRTSIQKDAARMVRRKVMLGQALNIDLSNSQHRGVYINTSTTSNLLQQSGTTGTTSKNNNNNSRKDPTATSMHLNQNCLSLCDEVSYKQDGSIENGEAAQRKQILQEMAKTERNPLIHYASPFIEKVIKIMDRLVVPFEHVDTWVPSFVDSDTPSNDSVTGQSQQQKCRLCFAGCGTSQNKIDAGGQMVPLSADEAFDLMSFGEYSEKFSFEIGCGLPGRVYSSGVASWEQGIQNAPLQQFERSGGATQWGIQTVLGIPIPSPSAGRIVVLLYSTSDRPRDLKLVNRLTELISKLRPSPKWKLVVDIGVGPPEKLGEMSDEEAHLQHELLLLIQKYTPADKKSPHALFLPGFTSLRLLLIQQPRSVREDELLKSIVAVYAQHKKGGQRSEVDIAVSTARDFMVMSKSWNNNYALTGYQLGNNVPNAGQHLQNQTQHENNSLADTLEKQRNIAQATGVLNGQQHIYSGNSNFDGNSVHDALILNTFSQMSGHAFNPGMASYGVSPALHSIAASPAFMSSHGNFESLSNSPTLQPIPTQQAATGLATIGISSSPISDMLKNNGATQFQEM